MRVDVRLTEPELKGITIELDAVEARELDAFLRAPYFLKMSEARQDHPIAHALLGQLKPLDVVRS